MKTHTTNTRAHRLAIALACSALALSGIGAVANAASLTGSPGDDTLIGTVASDTLFGLAGNDQIRGGPGGDVLDGGPGNDDLSGGAGRDAVVYPGPSAVTVTLDDLANDGQADEHDNAQTDIEDVYGGDGPDQLSGSAGEEALDGGAGDDIVDGAAGEDELYGGAGNDRLLARDGRPDTVDCGPDEDIAIVDEHDQVRKCEIVDRRPAVPRVDVTTPYTWVRVGKATIFTSLDLTDLAPRRPRVEVRCAGTGCQFSHRRPAPGQTRLGALVRDTALQPGARLEIVIRAPGRLGKLVTLHARQDLAPLLHTECLARATDRPVRCQ